MSFYDYIVLVLNSHNWVVARRTKRIVAKYGDDVVCISQKRYSHIRAEYDAL